MNVNSFAQWQNLPVQSITGTTETTLVVPAEGLYPGLPSPTLAAGSGLYLGINPDLAGNETYDGHPFVVRVAGRATTVGTLNFTMKLYQVPGKIAVAGTSSTVANDNVVAALAATSIASATENFVLEAEFFWDSVTKAMNGYVTAAQIGGVNIAANSGTVGTLVATTPVASLGLSDMNFIPSFTFSGAAANSVQLTEFAITRA